MHRFQSSVPASALPSNHFPHQQTIRLNTSSQTIPHNQYVNNYTPVITNPSVDAPNKINPVTSPDHSSEELSDMSSIALPDLLKAINPQLETEWKVGAPDAYQVLLSNHSKTPQQQMSAYLDQVVTGNSTSSFPVSHGQSANPEQVITQESHLPQVPTAHPTLAYATQTPVQTQPPASVPAMTHNAAALATQKSIAGSTSSVPAISMQSSAHPGAHVNAPVIQGLAVPTSVMAPPSNIGPHTMYTGPMISRNASRTGAMLQPTLTDGHALVTGPMITGEQASHPIPPASQVAQVASAPMPVANMRDLQMQNSINSVSVVAQAPQPQGTAQSGSNRAMLAGGNVSQAANATNVVVNRAAAAAAAAAAGMSSPMQVNPIYGNQGGHIVPTSSAVTGRENGKRKNYSKTRRSGSPRKVKVFDKLTTKPLKEEEFTMEIEPVNGSKGDGSGYDEVETKKAMRAERNRQSAAASRERKKHYIKELEKRVGVLSKANAEIQMEQLKVLKETIATERRHDLTVTFKNMEIAKLKNQVAELSPSPLAAQTQPDRKTWDAADFAARAAMFKS